MSPLPAPDPAEGAAAESQAAEARSSALGELSEGDLTLEELFRAVDDEEPAHQLGHIHVRAALLALPQIGETRADEILEAVGLEGDRHLDTIGSLEQEALLAEVAQHQG